MGTAALTLSGGLSQYIGGETTPLRLAIIIAITFVASATKRLSRTLKALLKTAS